MTFVAIGLILSSATGCNRDHASPDKPATKGFIGIIGPDRSDPSFKIIQSRVQQYRFGGRPIELRVDAPTSRDAEAQMRIIRKWKSEDLVGLCIQVVDAEQQLSELLKIRTTGVIVVTMMDDLDYADPFLHVGPDDRSLGQDLADLVHRVLGNEATLCLLTDSKPSPMVRRRSDAFRHRLRTYGLLHVLAEEDCLGMPPKAVTLMSERMQRYPNLNAWVSAENWPLRSDGDITSALLGQCKFFTIDAFPSTSIWFSDTHFGGTIINHYDEIVDEAIAMCSHAVRGDTLINQKITSEYTIVLPQNRAEFQEVWNGWTNPPSTPGNP